MGETEGPGTLDAISLLAQTTEELVVAGVRDTHLAIVARARSLSQQKAGLTGAAPQYLHEAVAGGVYATIGLSLKGASTGLGMAASAGLGPRLESGPGGRLFSSIVNGLIGDRLSHERPAMAIDMAPRVGNHNVPLRPQALAAAYPEATGRVVVLIHGLFENDASWQRARDERTTTYAEQLTEQGWTPVVLRVNTGLSVLENGEKLHRLLHNLVAGWPVPVERIVLLGHSQGGLVARAGIASALAETLEEEAQYLSHDHGSEPAPQFDPWVNRLTDVITLGTPHRGAPLAGGVAKAATGLSRFPESAAWARLLDSRSVGVHDLVEGLGEEVPGHPEVRFRLVSGSVTRSQSHPLGSFIGDYLVRIPSAHGRRAGHADLFPEADTLHVPGADHFDLLNDEQVAEALLEWLA